MRVFIQFSIFFTLVLVTITQFVAGALLLREYFRRRNQMHLFYFAVGLLIASFGSLLSLSGVVLSNQGFPELGQTLTSLYSVVIIVNSLFFAYGLINVYARKHRGWLAIISTVTALAAVAISSQEVMSVFGQVLPAATPNGFVVSYGYWFLLHLVMAIVAARAYVEGRRNGRADIEADRMMLIGALLTMFVFVYIALILSVQFIGGAAIVYLSLTIATAYKYLGVVAKHHPDQRVQQKPSQAITSSITVKVVAACGLFYIALSFIFLSTITQYFVASSVVKQHEQIQTNLEQAMREYDYRRESLVMMSEIVARHDNTMLAVRGDKSAMSKIISMAEKNESIQLDIVDLAGNPLASSQHQIDNDYSFADLSSVQSALQGESAVGTHKIWTPGIWSTVATSPIINTDGVVLGAVVLSQPFGEWQTPFCLNRAGISVSGCGFISSDSGPIATSGQEIDALAIDKFKTAVRIGSNRGQGYTDRFDSFFVEAFRDRQGRVQEFYYAFITHADVDRSIARIMSVVGLMMILSFIIFAGLLVIGMRLFLRPVFLLQSAAARISGGDFGKPIDYHSLDELGQLADSFNRMSETVHDRTEKLDEKVREQRDAMSYMAREIRTPLNVFRWSLEMLRFGDVGALNNEQMELLEQMNQTNERIRKLVNELLEVARLEQGRIELKQEQILLTDLIDEIAGKFAVRAREKKIDFYWKHPEKELPSVIGDRVRLNEVLSHLIVNAIKFTEDGGHIEISLATAEESGPQHQSKGRYLLITIKDNGRGIPKKEQNRIFSKFYRSSTVVKDEIEGTGLGLYLSKHFIEMHGGEIWFESKEGDGTIFRLTIPLSRD
ncbi:MAG: ATP-binding protein [Patescibacteria group bacterium]